MVSSQSKRYEAFWIPGLDSDEPDQDEALEIGARWLKQASYPGGPIIVMNGVSMWGRLGMLTGRYHLVSPQSKDRHFQGGEHAVLAVWPAPRALNLAETLAFRGGLCVIPGRSYDLSAWILATGATNVANPSAPVGSLGLDAAVRTVLDGIVQFGGHNGFLNAEEKIDAIQALRRMISAGHRPDPAAVREYVRATGNVYHDGAERLEVWYRGLLAGKSFRDYRRRSI
jgi:hypothetical protein